MCSEVYLTIYIFSSWSLGIVISLGAVSAEVGGSAGLQDRRPPPGRAVAGGQHTFLRAAHSAGSGEAGGSLKGRDLAWARAGAGAGAGCTSKGGGGGVGGQCAWAAEGRAAGGRGNGRRLQTLPARSLAFLQDHCGANKDFQQEDGMVKLFFNKIKI